MRGFRLAALCAASVVTLAGATRAATVVTLTFDGTVTSGTDELGLFGAAGTNLAGDAFSAFFQFTDLSLSPGKHEVFGPADAATITIGGVTFDLPDFTGAEGLNASLLTGPGNPLLGIAEVFGSGPEGSIELLSESKTPTLVGTTLTIPFPADPFFSVTQRLRLAGMSQDIVFNTDSATASPILAAVSAPEPATWALMILGFGGVGAMLRRRRSGPALA